MSFKTAQKTYLTNEIKERYLYVNQKSFELVILFEGSQGIESIVLNKKKYQIKSN